MTSPPAIAGEKLRVERGDTTILRGIDVSAGAGEVVGILGPSGAGKSTLFRALVGEVPVASGAVRLLGDDVTSEPLWSRARRGLSYLPQSPSVLWDLSVAENLSVYHRIATGRDEPEAVRALAERVSLTERLSVRAGELSGGERRRLELGRALARPPRVLVCDEPFSGVDPQQASRLADMILALARDEGVAVLLADHHVEEALRVCTRAILLLDGQIAVEESDPASFREHPIVVGRYLGNWSQSMPPSTR